MIDYFINKRKIGIFSFVPFFTGLLACSSPPKGYLQTLNGDLPSLVPEERCRVLRYVYDKSWNREQKTREEAMHDKKVLKHYILEHLSSGAKPCTAILGED